MSNSNGTPTGTGTSRAAASRAAVRRPLKSRLSISGAAGSGKTWTGLQIAAVLADGKPVVWIDTEATTEDVASSETYADAFDFEVINWQRSWGYDPRDLIATLWDLARRKNPPAAVGIDSASHYWRGPGGTLEIADGRFTGWKGARPVQDGLVEALLAMPFHVIVCTRAKMAHAVDDSSGRQVVTKLGLAPIQSDDLEYEMQVALVIDADHRIDVSKTRASVLAGKSWQANKETDFAVLFKSWLDKGESVIRQRDADALVSTALALPTDDRPGYREAFKATWGSPAFLTPEQLDAVWAWVHATVDVQPHDFYPLDSPNENFCSVCKTRQACRWHRSDAPTSIGNGAVAPGEPHNESGVVGTAGTGSDALEGAVGVDADAEDDAWRAEASRKAEEDAAAVAGLAPEPARRGKKE